MNYIQKIREIRIKNNITQTDMSISLGLSKSAYGLYETGQRQMDIETFVKICRILNLTPNYLLGFE